MAKAAGLISAKRGAVTATHPAPSRLSAGTPAAAHAVRQPVGHSSVEVEAAIRGEAAWSFVDTPVYSAEKVQAKLAVGAIDDPLEREADVVASRVMSGTVSGPISTAPLAASRKCATCEEEETIPRRKENVSGARGGGAPAVVAHALGASGKPLDASTRSFFEPRFARDLGDVRIIADDLGARSAAAIGARAYTVGNRIAIASGQYNPATTSGRTLLAHELAHVVQQSGGRNPAPPIIRRQVTPTPTGATPAPARPGRIISERFAPDGTVIDIEVGTSVQRLGLEDTLPSATEVSLEGWQRAHQVGPGLGVESARGIRYAPPEVNLVYQNAGIERFIREFNLEKSDGVRLFLRTVTQTHPNSLRLKSITYRLAAAHGDGSPVGLFEVGIEIPNVTNKPRVTLDAPEVLGDWKAFLSPKGPGVAATDAHGGAPAKAGGSPQSSARTVKNKSAGPAVEDTVAAGEHVAPVQVETKIEVVDSVTNPNGTTVSEVAYDFGGSVDKLNAGAPAGGGMPRRLLVKVTQNADGSIAGVESLSGQPQSMVEALALKTLAGAGNEAAGVAEGATAGVAGAAGPRMALLFKGLRIGGTAAFAVITAYQLYEATPKQRPRVLAGAAGGLAGGALSGFLVCNLLLDIETAGWGLLFCGLVVGGGGAYAGTAASEAAYDGATVIDLDRVYRILAGKRPNEIGIFNVLVTKMGSDDCVDVDFLGDFMRTFPEKTTDTEAVLLAAQLTEAVIQPTSHVAMMRPKTLNFDLSEEGVCPTCHGRSGKNVQAQAMTRAAIEAMQTVSPCSAIKSQAINALRKAIKNLPPRTRAQMIHPAYQLTPKPPPGVNEHASPSGYRPPNSNLREFPTQQEQLGEICPNCHAETRAKAVWKNFGPGLGSGADGAVIETDYKQIAEYVRGTNP